MFGLSQIFMKLSLRDVHYVSCQTPFPSMSRFVTKLKTQLPLYCGRNVCIAQIQNCLSFIHDQLSAEPLTNYRCDIIVH